MLTGVVPEVAGARPLASRASHAARRRRNTYRRRLVCVRGEHDLQSGATSSMGAATSAASDAMLLESMDHHEIRIPFAQDQEITIETGEIGRLAGGAAMLRCGETVVYATACAEREAASDADGLPLQVVFQERLSAAGRTSTGFIKRDRMREVDTLVSRLIDRPLRPVFPRGWTTSTQVLAWVLSYDPSCNPHPHAITAASAALLLSDVPFSTAVAGAQVGRVDGRLVVNPRDDQMAESDLDVVVAGTKTSVLMIEGWGSFVSDEDMVEAVALAQAAVQGICERMEPALLALSKAKRPVLEPVPDWMQQRLAATEVDDLRAALAIQTKQRRGQAVAEVRERLKGQLLQTAAESAAQQGGDGAVGQRAAITDTAVPARSAEDRDESRSLLDVQALRALKQLESRLMRANVIEGGTRTDGRGCGDVRPIAARCSFLPRAHGSALFSRGETQVMVTATLGSATSAMRVEGLALEDDEELRRFYLQYIFPPSSVGEVGRAGGMPGRREVGHGMLAERALAAAVAEAQEDFPYVVRVESHVTDSNGSSSMASVCGGCLAMLDAGVPLKQRVAGVAMGLILSDDGSYRILTDILGLEDALGDMDFKVAGGADSITALQMDIKVEGISVDILRAAIGEARKGIRHVLGEMEAARPAPAQRLSKYCPRLCTLSFPAEKTGMVIGPKGSTIIRIREMFPNVDVRVDDGVASVMAMSEHSAESDAALQHIRDLTVDIKPGEIFEGCKVLSFSPDGGVIVELRGGRDALVPVNELSLEPVASAAELLEVGQTLDIVVVYVTSEGRFRASAAALQRFRRSAADGEDLDLADVVASSAAALRKKDAHGGVRKKMGGSGESNGARGSGSGSKKPSLTLIMPLKDNEAGAIIGKGGSRIGGVRKKFPTVDIIVTSDDVTVRYAEPEAAAARRALAFLQTMMRDIKEGEVVRGCEVYKVLSAGVLIGLPGDKQGMVPGTELEKVPRISNAIVKGAIVDVVITKITGKKVLAALATPEDLAKAGPDPLKVEEASADELEMGPHQAAATGAYGSG